MLACLAADRCVSVLHCLSRCCRVNTPDSIELAMAGVCAAILVAACQDTAVELLTWPGRPRPAAIAITGVLPGLWPACRHRVAAACPCGAAVSARVWAAVLQASSACQHAGCGFGPVCSAGSALERAKPWAGRHYLCVHALLAADTAPTAVAWALGPHVYQPTCLVLQSL